MVKVFSRRLQEVSGKQSTESWNIPRKGRWLQIAVFTDNL